MAPAFKRTRGKQEPPPLAVLLSRGVLSARVHSPHTDPHKSGLAVAVVATGHMREFQRCAPRLVAAVLRPNDAIMTLTTYPSYTTLGLPLRHYGGPNTQEMAKERKKELQARSRGGGNRTKRIKTKKEISEMLEMVPSLLKKSVSHEQLRSTYGEHLGLSVMLNSGGLLTLAQESAPGVTFGHFITVLAQWAAIEIAYEKTFSFLKNESSEAWSAAYQSDRIVFLRLRPDIFIIGTMLLFRLTATAHAAAAGGGGGGDSMVVDDTVAHRRAELNLDQHPLRDKSIAQPPRIELVLECGAEPESKSRSESPARSYTHSVRFDARTNDVTVWRTPPFPEFFWPPDPLSDYSAITVGSPDVSQASRSSFRMWSWVLNRPHPENYSYVAPENATQQFLESSGFKTEPVPFGWHFILRAEGYRRVYRTSMRVRKYLRANATRIFRTDDSNSVQCPPQYPIHVPLR